MPEIPKHAKFLAETNQDGKKSDEVLDQNTEELKKQALKVYVEKYYKTKKQAQELKQKDPKKATEILKTAAKILDDIKELKESSAMGVIDKIIEKYKIKNVITAAREKAEKIKDWQDFYKEVFDMEFDLSKVEIPKKREGFDRLIIVAPGMTPQKLYEKCEELFGCKKITNENLDNIITSDRTAEAGAYAVLFREGRGPDNELINKSANELKTEGVLGITLEERFLYELKYFKEFNKHLDIGKGTLCSGSRYADGNVPDIYWSGIRLELGKYDPDKGSDVFGARAAVIIES